MLEYRQSSPWRPRTPRYRLVPRSSLAVPPAKWVSRTLGRSFLERTDPRLDAAMVVDVDVKCNVPGCSPSAQRDELCSVGPIASPQVLPAGTPLYKLRAQPQTATPSRPRTPRFVVSTSAGCLALVNHRSVYSRTASGVYSSRTLTAQQQAIKTQ